MRRAEDDAAMAVDTILITAQDPVILLVIIVRLVAALIYADLAADAQVLVATYDVLRFQVALQVATKIGAFFKVAATGSPPRGFQTFSSVGFAARMAASSEER